MRLSIRQPRTMRTSAVVALVVGTSCAAAVIATAGTADASVPGSPTATHQPTAAASAAHGRIAFSQWDLLPGGNLTGHSNVYAINPDGTDRRQLTHVGAAKAAGAPGWSPNGTKIVYESNQTGDYRIWVMNADGSGQQQLTNVPGFADLEPAWSPNGSHIVFSRCDDHLGFIAGCDLEVMNAAGTGVHRLAGGHWTYVRAEYSPDGKRIVVAADRGGFQSVLWVMRSNGTGLHRITRPSLEAFWPSWSPNGRRILFTDNCCQGNSNLWTVRPNGTGLTELTHLHPGLLQVGFASYSPSGRQIVLQYNGKCPRRGLCGYLYVMNADGSGLHPVHTGIPNTFLTDWGRAS